MSMTFVYEELTQDRKKDFPELSGKYPKGWYIDKERNICIWGGLAAGHWMPISEGDYSWKFYLGINHEWFEFILEPGNGSKEFKDNPYVIKWDRIILINALFERSNTYSKSGLIVHLKEALSAWGAGPAANKHISEFVVDFNF